MSKDLNYDRILANLLNKQARQEKALEETTQHIQLIKNTMQQKGGK